MSDALSLQPKSPAANLALTKNDLLVLSFLLDRPMHGYEISQCIKDSDVPVWFDISTAAIYYSLNKLHRRGLVSETRSQGGAAEKSVYHLTERGREQFFANMEVALGSEKPMHFEYDLGIFLLNKLPQQRALALLEQRLDFLHRWQDRLRDSLAKVMGNGPAVGGDLLQATVVGHAAAHARTEIEWMTSFIHQLRGEEQKTEQDRGLMILAGNLQDHHLPELVKLIASGRHSGSLSVTDGACTRTLSFHLGRPVCATSLRPNGEVRIPQQIMDDIYDLFRWSEGDFSFDQYIGPQEDCLVLRLSPESLILAGTRWVDDWALIQRVVPSPETIFERRDDRVLPDDFQLSEMERLILDTLDGFKDVATIGQECAFTEFESSRILYTLQVTGLARPSDLSKIRLRRLFREIVELACRSTQSRLTPADESCERAINERTTDMPIRIIAGRVEDRADPKLTATELAKIYRTFLQTQRAVIGELFGKEAEDDILQQAITHVGPKLRDTLKRYDLLPNLAIPPAAANSKEG